MTTTLAPRPRSTGAATDSAPSGRLPDRITHMPILILNPHSRCNCRCLMCDIWRATARDEIDAARVAAEVDRWRALGVRRVVLSGGEPLMHRDLWALVGPLAAAGIGITLITTGLLLRRHAAAIARYVDDVVVSLDGPPAVHDAIRGVPGAFDKLVDGVAAVRAAARAVALEEGRAAEGEVGPAESGTAVSARCTVQRANCGDLGATVRAARTMGADRISFLAVDVSSEAFNRPGGWPEGRRVAVAPGIEDLPRLREALDRLAVENGADFAAGFIAESPAKLEARLYEFFAALCGRGDFPPVTCNAPWVSAVVEADGTVRPCFFHEPIGAWGGGVSLEGVVNGPPAVAFRQGLDVRSHPVCQRCVCSLNLAVDEPRGGG